MILLLILLLASSVNAAWYQVQKFSYEENATTATWTYAGSFYIGPSTSSTKIILLSSGTIRAVDAGFSGVINTSQTVGGIFSSYYGAASTATIIHAQGSFYLLKGTSSLTCGPGWFDMPQNMRLRYVGKKTKIFTVNASICLDISGGTNQLIEMRLYKNGAWTGCATADVSLTASGAHQHMQFATTIPLTIGDYLEAFITNNSGTNSILMDKFSMTATAAQ